MFCCIGQTARSDNATRALSNRALWRNLLAAFDGFAQRRSKDACKRRQARSNARVAHVTGASKICKQIHAATRSTLSKLNCFSGMRVLSNPEIVKGIRGFPRKYPCRWAVGTPDARNRHEDYIQLRYSFK